MSVLSSNAGQIRYAGDRHFALVDPRPHNVIRTRGVPPARMRVNPAVGAVGEPHAHPAAEFLDDVGRQAQPRVHDRQVAGFDRTRP